MYCGHNAGEEFLSSKHALRLRSTPNVMMLVGCSSGRLRDEGMFEPHGTMILQYACAGVPCIVANLWDVTDGDIDRFLIRVLEELRRQGCGRETVMSVPCFVLSPLRDRRVSFNMLWVLHRFVMVCLLS